MSPQATFDRYVAFDHCRHRLPSFTWSRSPAACAQIHRLALELSQSGALASGRFHQAVAAALYLLSGTRQIARSFFQQARAARRIHRVPLLRQLVGLGHLAFRRNAAPDAYYVHRFFRSSDLRRSGAFFEHRELQVLLRALHRGLDTDAVADKLRFHELCRGHGLPTPPLWAVFHDGAPVPEFGSRWLRDPRSDVFLKPATDYAGHGIVRWCFRPETGTYSDGSRNLTHAELTAEIAASTRDAGTVLVQPRLHEGPALADLAAGAVCNYRILTGCAPDSTPVVLTAVVRLPCPGHYLTDVGNDILAAPVDVATGRLGAAQAKDINRGLHLRHPATGAPIEGRTIPTWSALAELACRAHAACNWMPFVGWDVVDSTEGPMLLEANAYWGGNLCQMSGHRFLGETTFPAIFLAHLQRLRPDLVPFLQS